MTVHYHAQAVPLQEPAVDGCNIASRQSRHCRQVVHRMDPEVPAAVDRMNQMAVAVRKVAVEDFESRTLSNTTYRVLSTFSFECFRY